jgi:hypothetical protein
VRFKVGDRIVNEDGWVVTVAAANERLHDSFYVVVHTLLHGPGGGFSVSNYSMSQHWIEKHYTLDPNGVELMLGCL